MKIGLIVRHAGDIENELTKVQNFGFDCCQIQSWHTDLFTDENAALIRRLLQEKHVAVVPGNAFGECGDGFVRVSYSYSLKHLKIALQRIREFIEELKNGN